jgi:hypothetical protein
MTLLLMILTSASFAAEESPFVTSARDQAGVLVRWERDRNGDGKIDERMTRDGDGTVVLENDRDHDGRFEELTTQEFLRDDLVTEIVETDRDGDGKRERKVHRTFAKDQDQLVETFFENGEVTDIRKSKIRSSR